MSMVEAHVKQGIRVEIGRRSEGLLRQDLPVSEGELSHLSNSLTLGEISALDTLQEPPPCLRRRFCASFNVYLSSLYTSIPHSYISHPPEASRSSGFIDTDRRSHPAEGRFVVVARHRRLVSKYQTDVTEP